jgi:hypothetical protein
MGNHGKTRGLGTLAAIGGSGLVVPSLVVFAVETFFFRIRAPFEPLSHRVHTPVSTFAFYPVFERSSSGLR